MGSKNRILILGSTGRVGRALAACWPDDVPALWQHRPGATAPRGPALAWDMLNAPAPDLVGITGIVQLAGGTSPDQQAATTPLALVACDLGARLGVPVLVASSQAVYGRHAGPAHEDSPCHPIAAYGRAKLAMEAAVAGRAVCLRIGNVAGCDTLAFNAAAGQVPLERLPDQTSPRRAYIGPATLGAVIRGLLAHPGPLPSLINVAQPGTLPMLALLEAAGADWYWIKANPDALAELALDVTRLTELVPVPPASAAGLIDEARAAGWAPA